MQGIIEFSHNFIDHLIALQDEKAPGFTAPEIFAFLYSTRYNLLFVSTTQSTSLSIQFAA